jgi:hypothetical protein
MLMLSHRKTLPSFGCKFNLHRGSCRTIWSRVPFLFASSLARYPHRLLPSERRALDEPPVSDSENSLRARQIDCVECLVADRETDNDGDGTEDQHIGGKEEDGHSQSARSSSRIEDTYGRGLRSSSFKWWTSLMTITKTSLPISG